MRGSAHGNAWVGFVACAMLTALSSAPGIAFGQSLKEQIVGAWRLTALYNENNGVKTHTFGEKPVGLAIYDRSGNVSQYLSKPEVPKFAEPNRLKGTDKEYRQVMQSLISGIGTYTVDGDTVTIKWIASTYPNRTGTTEKRVHKIQGDVMTVVNPTAASGGTAYVTYMRAK